MLFKLYVIRLVFVVCVCVCESSVLFKVVEFNALGLTSYQKKMHVDFDLR